MDLATFCFPLKVFRLLFGTMWTMSYDQRYTMSIHEADPTSEKPRVMNAVIGAAVIVIIIAIAITLLIAMIVDRDLCEDVGTTWHQMVANWTHRLMRKIFMQLESLMEFENTDRSFIWKTQFIIILSVFVDIIVDSP